MDSLATRQNIFLSAALLAAQASYNQGFRLRDVLFFCELFQNWLSNGLLSNLQTPQRTQVLRWLNELTKQGQIKVGRSKTHPIYQLTSLGLISSLDSLAVSRAQSHGSYFYFHFYFIKAYKNALKNLILENRKLPPAYEEQLNLMLDEKELLQLELKSTKKHLARIETRIAEAKASAKLFSELNKKQKLSDITRILEQKYPYELNSQKSLSELINLIPEAQRSWELNEGNLFRAENIWVPQKKLLEQHLINLEVLALNRR